MNFLYVFLGGGIGCVIRYAISVLFARNFVQNLPFSTFIVNVAGSLLIGFVYGYFYQRTTFNDFVHPLLIAGFLGGFTTFSAFSWETYQLFNQQSVTYALLNIIMHVVGCLIAVAVGAWLSKHFIA